MRLLPSFVIDKRRFYSQKSTNMFFILANRGSRSSASASFSNSTVQMLLIGLCLGVTFGFAFIPIFEGSNCDNSFTGPAGAVLYSKQEILLPGPPENIPLLPMTNEAEPQQQSILASSINNGVAVNDNNSKTANTNTNPEDAAIADKKKPETPAFHRPRFVSTELGLRKKVIVGIVLSDSSSIDNLLLINQTLAQYVDKTIFFINGSNTELVTQLKVQKLPGAIPIPTSKELMKDIGNQTTEDRNRILYNYIALKGIKYIGDKFRDSYDYFFLTLDLYYVHGRALVESLKKISVKNEIIWGNPGIGENASCILESGFVLSRSLVTLLGARVIRCLESSILQSKLSGSVSKCIQHLAPGFPCQNIIQDQQYRTVEDSDDVETITKAITVGPILSSQQILQIHWKMCKNREIKIKEEILHLQRLITWLAPKSPKKWQKLSWPIGLPSTGKPKTRFDINKWTYFTPTTMYLQSEFISSSSLEGIESLDITNILKSSYRFLEESDKGKSLGIETMAGPRMYQFLHGYRRFDPVRGMEYILDFEEEFSHQIHRIEGLRPLLGNIEIVPVPFVTETKRLTIIVPITLDNVNQTHYFLDRWFDTTTDHKLNTVVILALVDLPKSTETISTSLGPEHIEDIKQLINQYNSKVPKPNTTKSTSTGNGSDSLKVVYVVVNLNDSPSSSMLYSKTQLTFDILDYLGKRVIGFNALVLVLKPSINIKDDFLNRVRMNTIFNFQVYSPIPFVEYIPIVAYYKAEYSIPKELPINKLNGYFDSSEIDTISFYYGDYINAKRGIGESNLANAESLLNFFMQGTSLHVFRATEPALHIRIPHTGLIHYESVCERNITHCSQTWWGSKGQLAKIVMSSGVFK